MKKSNFLLVILLALSQVLIACGGGGGEPVTTLDVELTEQKFIPDEFTVPAGTEITIHLNNTGIRLHEFQILVLGAKVDESVDTDGNSTMYWVGHARPGESETLTFTAPSEPGKYFVKCSVPGHTEAGMVATLYVK